MAFDNIDETIEVKNNSVNIDAAEYSLLQKMGENDKREVTNAPEIQSMWSPMMEIGMMQDSKYEGSFTPKKYINH